MLSSLKNRTLGTSPVFFFFFLVGAAQAQNEWQIADRNTVRLAPSMFTQLPKPIIRNLEQRQCLVPQSSGLNERHNVISGEFKQRGRHDWAVLCSRNGSSSILIYWNGSPKTVSEIAKSEDKGYLQGEGGGKIGFSRVIGAVDANFTMKHYRDYGGPKPPVITHNGIEDAFAEKASAVLYLHRGKWLELQGAD